MTTEIQMANLIANMYTSILFFNYGVFVSGLCVMIAYNPLQYGCDHLPKKFLLGVYICIIAVINLLYLWNFH
jgi:hypothetical protein